MTIARSRKRLRGIFLLDLLTAVIVLTAFATVLLVALNRTAGAADKLANDRAAIEAAQRTLLALQMRQPAPDLGTGVKVRIEPAKAGWVKVTTTVEGRTVTLTGWTPGGGQ